MALEGREQIAAMEPYAPPPAVSGGKNKDIEMLRAVAVSGVVAYHAPAILPSFQGDFADVFARFNLAAGVDLFFVISGFVIARSLLPHLASASSRSERMRETLAFWIRRAFRIIPTAWLWLALVLAVTAAFQFDSPLLGFDTNLDAGIAGAFFMANFRFAEAFGGGFPYGATPQYWSLAVEEQFYLLLPLLVLLIKPRWWVLVFVLMAVADVWRPHGYLVRVGWTSTLLLGVMIAIWSERPSYGRLAKVFAKSPGWLALLISLAAIACIALSRMLGPMTLPERTALALAAGLCVLLASFNRDALCPPGILQRVFLWIGSRSYALYVIHFFVFMIAHDIAVRAAPQPVWPLEFSLFVLLCSLAIIAALAELNYTYVETPLRRFGRRLAERVSGGAAGSQLGGKQPASLRP